MAHWQRKLDLSDVWEKAVDEEISITELSGIVADRLENLPGFGSNFDRIDEEKRLLVDEFRNLSEDEECDSDRFDYFFHLLYDWAD